MKEKRKNKQRTSQGVTLIALVVTIVILIILAAVSMNMVLGDQGIFKKAQEGANSMHDAEVNTQVGFNSITDEIDRITSGQNEKLVIPGPTPQPPTGGTEMDDMTNGIIEIKWLSGTSNNVSSSPNAPLIKNDLPSGTTMEQVVFDEESSLWITGTEYSYIAGTGSSDNTASHWANARVTKDGVESYFVWIPRYAYRIIYFDSLESKTAYQEGTLSEEEAVEQEKIIGYSDSRGIVDGHGRRIESVTSESNTTHTMVSEDYFMVHPAFTNGVNNGYANGEWDREIEGIWIGKYETSSVEGNDNNALDDVTTKTAKVQQGISSWSGISIGNAYIVAQLFQPELESHMLKNSEWGAVAYLTESKYGRNGTELARDDIVPGLFGVTGGGEGCYITYPKQSSTGNVYGIYDLDVWNTKPEHVAAYYNGEDADEEYLSNGSYFASKNGASSKWVTTYNSSWAGTLGQAYKYGDATFETSEWHEDSSSLAYKNYPFFYRGGYHSIVDDRSGVFAFEGGKGDADRCAFHIALVV